MTHPGAEGLAPRNDRGSQYLSIRYTERLVVAGIKSSPGRRGDCCDSAMAETTIGLYQTEVNHRRSPWHGREAAEYATPERIDWFKHRWLRASIGNIPPVEPESAYYLQRGDRPPGLIHTKDCYVYFNQRN